MTTDEQRIAIAAACGWTKPTASSANGLMGRPPGKICSFEYLPDYLKDLNAMHQMEKVLTDEQFDKYCYRLDAVGGMRHCTHATAAEKAEAFLRTLGLWTTTPTQNQ